MLTARDAIYGHASRADFTVNAGSQRAVKFWVRLGRNRTAPYKRLKRIRLFVSTCSEIALASVGWHERKLQRCIRDGYGLDAALVPEVTDCSPELVARNAELYSEGDTCTWPQMIGSNACRYLLLDESA